MAVSFTASATTALALWMATLCSAALAQVSKPGPQPQMADYIVAVVNQESVTAVEVRQRLERFKSEAARNRQGLPPDAELEKQVLDALIDERAMLSQARETGVRVEDGDVDRALANIAAQNQTNLIGLRQRIVQEGMDFNRFRTTIREQLMVERIREREVASRVRITDTEIENYIEKQRGDKAGEVEYNIAQILITVPDQASDSVLAERKARADAALARLRNGEDFAKVALAYSDDASKERGGELGLKSADRLPDIFLEAVRPLAPGALAPALLRSGAGFHILKLVDRRDSAAFRVPQTRARHILLRVNDQTSREAALRQMQNLRNEITRRGKPFEELARERSEDGSAPQGGDLGWATPGMFVPEFETAMNALPVGGISEPVVSRFGVHIIQVVERREVSLDSKQLRDQARNALREQKYEEAFSDWLKESRARSYVERREAPQL